MTDPAVENVDILIIGAGPVGMTLHLALAAGGQTSLLLDRRPPGSPASRPARLALSHGARELLEQIASWLQPRRDTDRNHPRSQRTASAAR